MQSNGQDRLLYSIITHFLGGGFKMQQRDKEEI